MTNKPRLDFDELERKNSKHYIYCEYCKQPMPRSSKSIYCMRCQDTHLFREVREYIRENNVNEFEVAEHFGIPLSLVKRWLKELRIEYVNPARDPKKFQ